MSFPGIEGKVAIVTGSGGGIGEGYARALAREGARVVVAEIDKAKGEAVAESIRGAGGEARFVEVDVASPASTAAMADAARDAFGGIDFLVNNAAIFGDMKLDSLLNVDWDYYKKFMGVNVDGALLCARACAKPMKERGGGAIVNQSSTAAWMGVGYYGLSKAATNGLTHCLARELGHMKIRVNAIAPGPTDTEALGKQVPDAFRDQLVNGLPLPRLGTPEDMANACLFLLSDAAAWVTGQIFAVDGGQITRA
jgi:NAD(P)-dependent dehydrogenase (short-subunit alcohol dehydrogenase family)